MVDGNKLGEVGFQKLGTPYSEMDCQAFIEWCLAQCGMRKDLAGSNAWYREVRKNGAIMTPEECVHQLGCVPKGAFLFIHANDGGEEKRGYHDGLGNASHIGICTGDRGEGAIHSSSSRGCVAESRFQGKTIKGGWNAVGLWDQVSYDYGKSGGGAEPQPAKKTLRRGDKGTEVAYVQAILMDLGYDLGSYGADGDFGRKTEEAVKKFQRANGLEPDGIVGEKTMAALENAGLVVKDTYTVILRHCTPEFVESVKQVFPEAEIQKEG